MTQIISIPMRTGNGLNDRNGHWRGRARKVKKERTDTAWMLTKLTKPTSFPVQVLLRRVAPSSGMDDDNLLGSLKAVRDAVAAWIGVDDRDKARVRYTYDQRRGPWSVEIEVTS